MKTRIFSLFALLALLISSCSRSGQTGERCTLFNDGWVFIRDSVAGAEALDYDDSQWLPVTLPHDFSMMPLEGGDSEEQCGPFSRLSPGFNHTGHVMGGTGWYRKSFTLPANTDGKSVTLLFDGAYMETDVWVNGKQVGSNCNGYTPFGLDITSALNPAGKENVVAVKVVNYGKNSRWYTGSGLYRDVRLVVTDPVHVALWGAYVTTPSVSTGQATVNVEVTVQNDGEADAEAGLLIKLSDKNGTVVAQSDEVTVAVAGASKTVVSKALTVSNPSLWSTDCPTLYDAEISVVTGGRTVDSYNVKFGIRTIELSAERGFLLNGEPLLLKGGCMHHDNGFLGAAAIARAERHRVEMMKENGYNAIRCSHNPPSEAFLNACDEVGLVVIDEFTDMWNLYKNHNDYSNHFDACWEDDLTRMMLRDRNHPSIIFWSIGNEIPKLNIEEGVRIGSMLRDKVKSIDDTRFVTEGVPSFTIHGGWKNTCNYFDILDVCGYNYMVAKYESDHALYPDRVIYASESYPVEAYDYWSAVERLPYVIGDFVWSAVDYIGEVAVARCSYVEKKDTRNMQTRDGIPMDTDPRRIFDLMNMFSVNNYPKYISWCGDIDIIGVKKPQGRYRDVLWGESVVEINVHEPRPEGLTEDWSLWGWPLEYPSWNWNVADGQPMEVRVFTRAPKVKLELNGEMVGEKSVGEADRYIAEFSVPYMAGELTAIALNADGSEAGRKVLQTTGKAVGLRLVADRTEIEACPSDLSFIRIEAVDEEGRVVPDADFIVNIDVPQTYGSLAASGNASEDGMAYVNRTAVKLYRGQAQAIVRPNGKKGAIKVSVTSEVGNASVDIKTR